MVIEINLSINYESYEACELVDMLTQVLSKVFGPEYVW